MHSHSCSVPVCTAAAWTALRLPVMARRSLNHSLGFILGLSVTISLSHGLTLSLSMCLPSVTLAATLHDEVLPSLAHRSHAAPLAVVVIALAAVVRSALG